jgi:5-oxoprolinase (ATP-hydrolysing) subunit A
MFPDINCDMGEGVGNDEAIMPYISSANIACGYHAGDADTMRKTIELCLKHNVKIGAHPSYPDRENFGRTDIYLPLPELYGLVTAQINLLDKIAKECGTTVHHVKPHGALYNMSARSKQRAAVVALAIKDVDDSLILYGLSKSYLISEAKKTGLKAWNEVFADRTYADDGRLTPRAKPCALIETEEEAVKQVLQMTEKGFVTSTGGKQIPVTADTVCIHGDGSHAVEFVKAINKALKK